MPTFYNEQQSWIARAAAETSLDFYNPISKGMDRFHSVTKMGSNNLIRRQALEAIGGYQPGLAEDLATSITLHAAGWRSAYAPEPLAPGLAPSHTAAWCTQQLKWARGVFEVLLTLLPRRLASLTWGERLAYMVRMTQYWIGPVVALHLLLTISALFKATPTALASFQSYLIHLLPLVLADMVIRQVALWHWGLPASLVNVQWRATTLIYATWPIYTLTWLMALLRLPLNFRPTPKNSTGGLNPLWLLPQMAALLLLAVGLFYSVYVSDVGNYPLVFGFALLQGVLHLGMGQWLDSEMVIRKG
jgi:cellulose synthase (UDP-forming)